MANLNKTFGHRLRALRDAKGLTQEELSRQVGIDYKHLGAVERGIKAPSFALIDKLARALKVEHYKLFLPVDAHEVDVEAELEAAMVGLRAERRARIQRFFQDVLRFIRRLDER